ncbi:hypothetical protein HK104_005348, partial [Borealophlyctis nickersoniae]
HDLSRLEVSVESCRKVRDFIEELANLTNLAAARDGGAGGAPASRRKLFGLGGAGGAVRGDRGVHVGEGGEGKRIDKLKNYLGSTANYLKGKKVGSWFHGGGGGTGQRQHLGNGGEGDDYDDLMNQGAGGGEEGDDSVEDDGMSVADSASSVGVSTLGGGEASDSSLKRSPSLRGKSDANGGGGADSISSSSAASVATTNTGSWNRSFTFAPPGVQMDAATFLESASGIPSSPPESPDFDRSTFSEVVVPPRDLVKVEIPFDRSQHGPCIALRWEWGCRTDVGVGFAVLYRPESTAGSSGMATLLPDSTTDGTSSKYIFPLMTVQAHARPARGDLMISTFDSGTFVAVWDGTSVAKKVAKSITYRIGVGEVPIPVPRPLDMKVGVGWCMGEIHVPRKSVGRCFLAWDGSCEGEGARIGWEFSTGGYDIVFGVLFVPLEEGGGVMRVEEVERAARPVPPVPSEQKEGEEDVVSIATASTTGNGYVSDDEKDEMKVAESAKDVGDLVKSETGVAVLADVMADVTDAATTSVADAEMSDKQSVLDSEDDITQGVGVSSPPPPKPPRSGRSSRPGSPPPKPPRESLKDRLAAAVGTKDGDETPSPSSTTHQQPQPKSAVAALLASRLAASRQAALSQAPPPPPSAAHDSNQQYVYPPTKVNSQKGVVTGHVDVVRAGKGGGVFVVVWDNAFSVVMGKNVVFRVYVLKEFLELRNICLEAVGLL